MAKTNDKAEAGRLASVVLDSLTQDVASDADALARQAFRSRSHFFRLFRALIDESPATMRRRLQLERSAWHLGHTRQPVTEIALDAGYGSLEAFTRAFRKAYRVSPSIYRRMGARHIHLPAPNGFHFHAPGSQSKGATMDLFDLFGGGDTWLNRRLLKYAADLTDEQLDRPLENKIKVFPWDTEDQTLRDMLDRIVRTKEVWTAALTGADASVIEEKPPSQRTPAAMLARLEAADKEFDRILGDVRNRAAWDDTFIDALCEPPETFTFGGMFAHVITFNTYRRLTALEIMRGYGVKVEGFGCPSEYEATLLAAQKS